jgi:predicted amidophosphoribosyltransferase
MPEPPPPPQRREPRQWWTGLADLLLPVACAGCGRVRAALCGGCRARLGGAGARRVRLAQAPPGLPPVFTAAEYGGVVRSVLLAHKERGALRLGRPLGQALAVAVRAAARHTDHPNGEEGHGEGELLLVPVPSARHSVKARGHDATRRIALAASAELRGAGLPASVLSALRRRREVLDQADLDPCQRLTNVAGAFEAAPASRALLPGARIVVVDDLLTTGASLAEAARAVRDAGGTVIAGATVAAPGVATAAGPAAGTAPAPFPKPQTFG